MIDTLKSIFLTRNIFLLFLTRAVKYFMLIIPVIVLFFQEHGLDMGQIMLLQAAFAVAVVIFEIPSGYLADRFKRKYSINIGFLLGIIGFSMFLFFQNFYGFLVGEIIMGLGAAFMSGADSGYLYDELEELGKTNDYKKIEGKYQAVGNFSEGIAAILAGFLALLSFQTVLVTQLGIMAIGFIVSLFLTEHKKNHKTGETISLKKVVNFLFKEKNNVKYVILFASILGSSTLTFVWFSQPLWKEAGLPLVYFGIIWAGVNFLVGLASIQSYQLENYFSFHHLLILFTTLVAVLYISLGLSDNLYIILLISSGFWILRGLNGPIFKDAINKQVPGSIRATVLSVQSFMFRGIFAILSPGLGYLADIYTLDIALIGSGVIFAILLIIAIILISLSSKKKLYL